MLACASIAFALPIATPDAGTSLMLQSSTTAKINSDTAAASVQILEARVYGGGGGCGGGTGISGALGAGRCYKEREIATPAGSYSTLSQPNCLILTLLQAKVEAFEVRNNGGGACGSEGQEGSLGHGRCYKERDTAESAAV